MLLYSDLLKLSLWHLPNQLWLQKFLHLGTLNNLFSIKLVKNVQIIIIMCKDTVVMIQKMDEKLLQIS